MFNKLSLILCCLVVCFAVHDAAKVRKGASESEDRQLLEWVMTGPSSITDYVSGMLGFGPEPTLPPRKPRPPRPKRPRRTTKAPATTPATGKKPVVPVLVPPKGKPLRERYPERWTD